MTTETAAAFPEPSPLVGAILDRHLAYMHDLVCLVKAGAPREELDRAGAAVNARIRAELVEPNGEAGWAAADEAADRMLAGVRLMAEALGVNLNREDAPQRP